MVKKAASPAAAGPAGTHLEASVAASYLLAMLAHTPPRGLPNTEITEVRVQQAPEGLPLDDVVVKAKDTDGNPVTLEIQVKRTVSFSPNDKIFEGVSDQIYEALGRVDKRGSHPLAGVIQAGICYGDVRLRRRPPDIGIDPMVSPALCLTTITALKSKFFPLPMVIAAGIGQMMINCASWRRALSATDKRQPQRGGRPEPLSPARKR